MVIADGFNMATAWQKMCAPWLSEDGSIYQRTDTAPAPSKDFVQIFVTPDDVTFRLWRIVPPTRADANQNPKEIKVKYEEFADDERIRADITRNLGEEELLYLDNLVAGRIDYITRLSRKTLLRVIFKLDLTSISKLSQANRLFRELCSCDALWSKIYIEHTSQPITHDLLMLTDQKGWKEVFFMNKLQLQVLLRRQTQKSGKEKRFKFGETLAKQK